MNENSTSFENKNERYQVTNYFRAKAGLLLSAMALPMAVSNIASAKAVETKAKTDIQVASISNHNLLMATELQAKGFIDKNTKNVIGAYQRLNDLPMTKNAGPKTTASIEGNMGVELINPKGVVVDLDRQIIVIPANDGPKIALVSTGSGESRELNGKTITANTPEGVFKFIFRVKGPRTSSETIAELTNKLGRPLTEEEIKNVEPNMYDPVYFDNYGHAVHGTKPASVPKLGNPASHGCIRVDPEISGLVAGLIRDGMYITIGHFDIVGGKFVRRNDTKQVDTTESTTTTMLVKRRDAKPENNNVVNSTTTTIPVIHEETTTTTTIPGPVGVRAKVTTVS